jgi:hypothetical protein
MAMHSAKDGIRTANSTALNQKVFGPPAIVATSWAILLTGVSAIFCCVYLMVVTYSPLPFWDGWLQVIYGAEGGNPFTLEWIWSQYNEHRMPIPKLFLLADLHWFHATQVFLLGSIFVILLLQLLVFAWTMRRLGGWRGSRLRTGIGLAAFCLFCLSQWENLTWGMQVCFVFPGLFATLSFLGLLLYWMKRWDSAPKRHWGYLLLSLAAALGASWCYANGNLLWPMLVVAALLLRLDLAAVLTYLVSGSVSTALYLYGYIRPASNLSVGSMPANFKYLAAYFGSSWVSTSQYYRVAECIGLVGFALAFFFVLKLRSDIERRRVLSIALVLLVLFCLASGMATALGRSQLGIAQAFSSRYQTVTLFFWCCLGLLLLDHLPTLQPACNRGLLIVQLALLVIMAVAASYAGAPLIRARVRGFRLNAGAMSLATDSNDRDQLQWVYWKPSALNLVNHYIREKRLSIYHEPILELLGQPLQSSVKLASPDRCSGAVESTTRMSVAGYPSLRITGWAWDNQRQEPPAAIITATQGTITGLGAVGDYRPMHKASRPWMAGNYLGYAAYLPNVGESDPVEIYAIVKGSPATACLVGTGK